MCLNDVLIDEEREEKVDEEIEINEMEAGLDELIDKYGYDKLDNTFFRRLQNNYNIPQGPKSEKADTMVTAQLLV